jgi:type II secretory pathway component PulF
MPRYHYRAQDADGHPHEGDMDESSARRVRMKLEERGLTVIQVNDTAPPRGMFRESSRLTWDELELLMGQLHSLTRHGLPLPPAIRAMAADLRGTRMRPVLEKLHRDLDAGHSLEEAVARQRDAFPMVFPVLLRAGEASGNLPGVLQMLMQFAARNVQARSRLQMNLAYPIAVLVACAVVVYFMLTKVVITYAEIFEEFGGHLPALTQFWVNLSRFATGNAQALQVGSLLAVALLAAAYIWLRRRDNERVWVDALWFRVPFWGRLYHLLTLARFARLLGLLLRARVPLLDSLELAGAGSGSPVFRQAAERASLQVAAGERLADALAATTVFPHSFCWLLGTGEDRGEAEQSLEFLAESADRELVARDRALGVMLAPVLIVLVGLLVLQIVVAMYLPIFTLG